MPENIKLRCALCHREYVRGTDGKTDFFPFCSERCQLQDLGSWLREEYVTSRPLNAEEQAELAELAEKAALEELEREDR